LINLVNNIPMADATALDLIYEAHRLLGKIEDAPRDYGTGDLLYSSDIHTVVAVSRSEGCNLTELASSLDISKPAASKFVKKLIRLGYLRKERPVDNGKELSLYLSDSGKRAVFAHEAFEKRIFGPLRSIEAGLAEGDRAVILNFLRSLQGALARER
jgi:DNA-binding MarR family transcriptional regulator